MVADWDPEVLTHHVCAPQWASLRSAFLHRQQRLWEGSFGLVDAEAVDRTVVQAMQQEELDGAGRPQTSGGSGDYDSGRAASALVLQKVLDDTSRLGRDGDGPASGALDVLPSMLSSGPTSILSGTRGVSLSDLSMRDDDGGSLLDRLRSRGR